jgi:hypothetical protein
VNLAWPRKRRKSIAARHAETWRHFDGPTRSTCAKGRRWRSRNIIGGENQLAGVRLQQARSGTAMGRKSNGRNRQIRSIKLYEEDGTFNIGKMGRTQIWRSWLHRDARTGKRQNTSAAAGCIVILVCDTKSCDRRFGRTPFSLDGGPILSRARASRAYDQCPLYGPTRGANVRHVNHAPHRKER